MNLSHLHYFTTLAQTKSFQATAQLESITQPTLSQAINGLERELDAQLFIRKKGSVELTEKGTLFYQYVSTSLRFLSNGVNMVKEDPMNYRFEMRMGSIFTAQSKEWSHLIYEFRQQTQLNVTINIQQDSPDALKRKLCNGDLDVAFVAEIPDDPEIAGFPCWTQQAVLIVNKQHPFAQRSSVSLDDLEGQYLISYKLEGSLGKALSQLIGDTPLQVGYRYKEEITLASLVLANPDVMAIACRSWLLEAYRSEVCLIPIKEAPDAFRTLYVAYRTSALDNKAVKEFIDLARKMVATDKLD